jgi:hypothetical protein
MSIFSTKREKAVARLRSFATIAALHKNSGSVAQLVEHGIEDPSVGGSIPSRATTLHHESGYEMLEALHTFS